MTRAAKFLDCRLGRGATRTLALFALLFTTGACAGNYGYRASMGPTVDAEGSLGAMVQLGVHGGVGLSREITSAAVVVMEGAGGTSEGDARIGAAFGYDYARFGPLSGRVGLRSTVLVSNDGRKLLSPQLVGAVSHRLHESKDLVGSELRVILPFDTREEEWGPLVFFLGGSLERHKRWTFDDPFPMKK